MSSPRHKLTQGICTFLHSAFFRDVGSWKDQTYLIISQMRTFPIEASNSCLGITPSSPSSFWSFLIHKNATGTVFGSFKAPFKLLMPTHGHLLTVFTKCPLACSTKYSIYHQFYNIVPTLNYHVWMTRQDLSCFCLQPWLVVSETLFWDIHICLDCYREEQLHFSQTAAKIKAMPKYLSIKASLKNSKKI